MGGDNINWGKLIMEVIVASVITGVFAVVAVLATNMFVDKRGYDKIDRKIGDINNETLTKQHENISNNISYNAKNLGKIQDKEFNRIYTKVDKIDEITTKNEGLYQNLNVDQKEVRNNVNKLVLDWEKTISENKDLKSQIEVYKSEKQELKIDNEKIKEKLNEIISNNEKVMEQNANLKAENQDIKEQLGKISSTANMFALENMELIDKNKKLSEKVSAMENLLDIKKKQSLDKQYNQEQDDELEL